MEFDNLVDRICSMDRNKMHENVRNSLDMIEYYRANRLDYTYDMFSSAHWSASINVHDNDELLNLLWSCMQVLQYGN
jgi:hypothetical protein